MVIRLRFVVLASLLFALYSYLVFIAFTCPSLDCLRTAYWVTILHWGGALLGTLLVLKQRASLRQWYIVSLLVLGDGILSAIEAGLMDNMTLIVISLISLLATLIVFLTRETVMLYLAVFSVFYVVFVSLLSGAYPEVIQASLVALFAGVLGTYLVEDLRTFSLLNPRYALLSISLGFILLFISGFVSVYGLTPYKLLYMHNLSTNCTSSYYCVRLQGGEVPVASWGYTIMLAILLAWNGVLLSLPLSPSPRLTR